MRVFAGQAVAKKHRLRAGLEMGLAAEHAAGQGFKTRRQVRMRRKQALIFQVHGFEYGGLAFIAVVKVLQGGKVVFWPQKLFAFNAQCPGNEQCFAGHFFVQVEQLVQFTGWQEIPVFHRATDVFHIGMVLDQFFLNLGVHAPVHAANTLHQAHRVPVQVVVDQARGVLQVQAFTEHIGGNQHAGFAVPLVGQVFAGHAVVVRGKLANHVAAAAFGGRVDLVNALDAGFFEFARQVAGGGHELAKNHDLVLFQHRVVLEQVDQGAQLVVVAGLELAQLVQEFGNLVQVLKRLGQDLRHFELVTVQHFGGFKHFLRNDVFVLLGFFACVVAK